MDRKQFLEQLAAPAGGKENIGLCEAEAAADAEPDAVND